MVETGWRQKGHHQKASVSDRGESNEEWEESPERVILNNEMYTIVRLEKKARKELLDKITPVLAHPTRTRRLAKVGLALKNKDKPKYLYDAGSHDELSDTAYEKYLAGVSSEKLEEGEVIRVGVERKGKDPIELFHKTKYPILDIKGLCYLAAMKVGAIEMFMWRKNITLKELVSYCYVSVQAYALKERCCDLTSA
jgi:hypothetical protein